MTLAIGCVLGLQVAPSLRLDLQSPGNIGGGNGQLADYKKAFLMECTKKAQGFNLD